MSATTAATTMMMMKVVLLSPAIFSGSSLAAAAEAKADAEAVTRTTVELREAVTTVVRTDRAAEVGVVDVASGSEDEDATAASTGSANDVSGWACSEVAGSSTMLGEAAADCST